MNAALVARVLGGVRSGNGFICHCPVPTHGSCRGDRKPSLFVKDGHTRLLVTCFAGCNSAEVLAELRRLGFSEGAMPRPLRHLETRSGDPRDGSYQRQQRAKAARLWSRSRSIEGTPAERYLRQARCYLGPIPKTLAFLPPIRPDQWPAMIAAYSLVDEPAPGVLGIPRNVDAVHLTLLRSDGSGKADIERNKLTIGQPRARPIMLAPPNDLLGLAICEGIEDGLSVYEATGLGVWAAGSAVYMPALAGAVPNYVEALTIYAHNDSGGQYALQLAKKLLKRGIEPFIEGLER